MKLLASFLTVAASECFSNWGDAKTGCFPKGITWKCTTTGFTMSGSLTALYENSKLLTKDQKRGFVKVRDTYRSKDSSLEKSFPFNPIGNVEIVQTWNDLAAKPKSVKDTKNGDKIRFSATISPPNPVVAKSK